MESGAGLEVHVMRDLGVASIQTTGPAIKSPLLSVISMSCGHVVLLGARSGMAMTPPRGAMGFNKVGLIESALPVNKVKCKKTKKVGMEYEVWRAMVFSCYYEQ
jgi:hypothetical protein